MSENQLLLQRIERLESQNLRMKMFGGALVAVSLFFGCSRIQESQKEVLTVRQLLIRDATGKTVATLGARDVGGTCLEVTGATRNSRAELCAGDDAGSALMLSVHGGEARAFLSAGSQLYEGGGRLAPGLLISDGDGENLISATVGSETRLAVGHGIEKNSGIISVTNSKPMLRLIGSDGKVIWTAP